MPVSKKHSIDTIETDENSGVSKEDYKNVHDFQIRDIMNAIANNQNTLANFIFTIK